MGTIRVRLELANANEGPLSDNPAPASDVRYRIEIRSAPPNTTKLMAHFLKGFGPFKNDGDVFTGNTTADRAQRIQEGVRSFGGDISVEFVRNGAPMSPGGAPPPTPRAEVPPAPTGPLPEIPMGVPSAGVQASGQTAASQPQAQAPQAKLGWEGSLHGWPYGDDYRRVDDNKLASLASKPRQWKDGKLKIQVGPNSDRHYLVEADRESANKGWIASQMHPDRPRTIIARDQYYSRVVLAVQKFERDSALARVMTSRVVDTAPGIPAPQVVQRGPSGPQPQVAHPNVSAPVPAPPTSGSGSSQTTGQPGPSPTGAFSLWTLTPGSTARWRALKGHDLVADDDLEELLQKIRQLDSATTIVFGWAGQVPPPRVEATRTEAVEATPQGVDSRENGTSLAKSPTATPSPANVELAEDLRRLGESLINGTSELEDHEDETYL